MLGHKERGQLELFISGRVGNSFLKIMYWYALIVFSIFHGCGMKSLTAISSRMGDLASIPKRPRSLLARPRSLPKAPGGLSTHLRHPANLRPRGCPSPSDPMSGTRRLMIFR